MLGRQPTNNERGSNLVEFAILAPLLILLVFGIFTVARAFNVNNTLEHAAREAARLGAVDTDLTAIQNAAQGEIAAASIPWGDVAFCIAEMDDATVDASAASGSVNGTPLAAPCVTVTNGAGADDPTSGERIQVLLAVPGYTLNFLLFDIDVDLIATAVSREEPGA